MDRNTRFAGNLPQPGQLARPVLENHCQVRRHRIFDPATASGTRQSGHHRPAQRYDRTTLPVRSSPHQVLLPRQGAPQPVLESPQRRAEVAVADAAGGKFS
jgi:hypothetical protein